MVNIVSEPLPLSMVTVNGLVPENPSASYTALNPKEEEELAAIELEFNTQFIRKFNNKASTIELICGKEFIISQRKKAGFRKALETFSQFI